MAAKPKIPSNFSGALYLTFLVLVLYLSSPLTAYNTASDSVIAGGCYNVCSWHQALSVFLQDQHITVLTSYADKNKILLIYIFIQF
jgi:hypothetical protein